MTEKNVTYLASIKPIEAEGKRLAQVYVIDPTLNRAGWKAKREAIERAKASLMKQPLLYEPGEGEESDWVEADDPFWGGSHKGEWVRAGQPVHIEESSDGSFHVTYDITSNHAWEDIINKRAKAASPSCEIYDAHLTRSREGGPPELELNDLEFNHVLLLPPGHEGAYPNAGVESFWETQAAWSGFTGAVASALDETSDEELDDAEEEQLEDMLQEAGVPVDETNVEAADKFIQKAIKRPGRVRNYLESRGLIKKGAPIPISLLQKLFNSTKDRSLKAAFLLAIRFKKGLKKKGVVGGAADPIGKKATRLKQLRVQRDQLQEKVNALDSSKEAAKKQELYTQLGAINREIEDLRFDIENHLEAMNGQSRATFTTLESELLSPEQPSQERRTLSNQPDLQKQLADKDAELTVKNIEIKDKDAKILALSTQVQEAGLSLKAHEEGLGVAHLEAKFKDAGLENQRLTKELMNTKAYGSMVENEFRKHIALELADLRIEAGVLKPAERDPYIAEAMKMPFDKLNERVVEAQAFVNKLRELGLGRRETYGAGAALAPPQKPNGYTVGDLSGVVK